MEILNTLLRFISDKSQKLKDRAAIVIIIISLAFFVNDLTGFTFNYRLEHKIEQAQGIAEVLNNPAVSPQLKKEMERMMEETLHRTTITDSMLDMLTSKPIRTKDVVRHGSLKDWNSILHLISSAVFTIILASFIIVFILIEHHGGPILSRIAFALVAANFFSLLVVVQYYMTLLIPPLLLGSWLWNYALNLLIQVAFYTFCYWIIKSSIRGYKEGAYRVVFMRRASKEESETGEFSGSI